MTISPEPNALATVFEQLVLPNVEPFDEDGDGDEPGGDDDDA